MGDGICVTINASLVYDSIYLIRCDPGANVRRRGVENFTS